MPDGEGKKKGRVNCLSACKGDPHALHTGAFASDAGCVCSWEKWSSGYSGRRCTLRLHTGVSWGIAGMAKIFAVFQVVRVLPWAGNECSVTGPLNWQLEHSDCLIFT